MINILKYKISRVIVLASSNLNANYLKASLIHEICLALKSYYNSYQINADQLWTFNGLINRIYHLDVVAGVVTKTLIKEWGLGLEEGLNNLAEEWLSKKVIDANYQVIAYQTITTMCENIITRFGDLEEINNHQFYKTLVNIPYYEEIVNLLDKVYQISLELLTNNENFAEKSTEFREIIKNEYFPLLTKLSRVRRL